MAEGWCRHIRGDAFDVYSAGVERHGMNERAIQVMSEAGVDISNHSSKTVEEMPDISFDYVVTVCGHAHEYCPVFPGGNIVHIGFQDPPKLAEGLSDEEQIINIYRQVRDEIRRFIENDLLQRLASF